VNRDGFSGDKCSSNPRSFLSYRYVVRRLGFTRTNHDFYLVGRPGPNPGILGLKEGCKSSDSSGGLGMIREAKKICPVVWDW
jgi:hypothetical protein